MILVPVLLNVILYLIQDSFIKKTDFEVTNVEIMLRFYEFFDPNKYQNSNLRIQEPTIIEEREIAEGHYENRKYDDVNIDSNNILGSLESRPSTGPEPPTVKK